MSEFNTQSPVGQPQEPIWPAGQPLPEGIEVVQFENTLLSDDEIENRFGFHKATIEGPNNSTAQHAELRENFKGFAKGLNRRLGKSREADLAQTALEEASMWAHKAIAKNDELQKED